MAIAPNWDLTDFYPNIDAKELKQDIELAEKKARDFAEKYQSNIAGLKIDEFDQAIVEYEAVQEMLAKIISYAFLAYVTQMTDARYSSFYQDISEKVNDISTITMFFTLEINKLDHEPKSNKYASWIRDLRVMKPYQLSDEVEKLLLEKSMTGKQSWNRLFDETLADLEFPYQDQKLNLSEIMHLLSSYDDRARKDAALTFGKVLNQNSRIFAMVTNVLAKDKDIEDSWRRFKSPISSRNISNLIEDEVVEAMVKAVKSSYPKLSHRYYKLKAKWLGKERLEYWDRNAPLPEDDDSLFSWDEARDLVLDAYGNFSPKMRDLGQKFFDNAWIDAEVKKGKDSGAFAHPTAPKIHPYLMVNFKGTSRDVMTLAHELGHGVHQLLSAKQGYLMSDTPLTLAETASVFGEQLTFQELLKRNPQKRKLLIASKIEDMLNTVIRQIAFLEFEKIIHERRKIGELSVQDICNIWMEVQKESLGDGVNLHGDYEYFWCYIPHFIHSPFYVYAYAFGDCLVNALYLVYKEGGVTDFEEKYFALLESGGVLRHKELLAPFGLDASDPEFWQKGLDVISGFIDEVELLSEI